MWFTHVALMSAVHFREEPQPHSASNSQMRAAAFEEKAAAQEREAKQARLVVRRTRAGLLAAVVLAVAAAWFGVDASNQKDRAVAAATEATRQTARAQAYVAQITMTKGDALRRRRRRWRG